MDEKLTTTVTLGGRIWPLRMTHNVLMLFSQITRVSLDQMEHQIGRYDYMILLLWLMVKEQDSQLKRETFDGWLNAIGIRGIVPMITAVGEAMRAAFPDPEEDAEEDGEEATADKSGADPM